MPKRKAVYLTTPKKPSLAITTDTGESGQKEKLIKTANETQTDPWEPEVKEVEKIIEVERIIKEIVTKEVQVPYEVIREIIKEVQVPYEIIKEVIKEVQVIEIREVVKEIPVTVT
jgi:hypothetical protein